MKCKVRGKRMILKKEDRYEVKESKSLLTVLGETPKTYEAFNCKHCGCQITVNIRLTEKVSTEGDERIKTKEE